MNYGYIYKFTFIPTGKFYVGKHKYEGHNSIDEKYGGSGVVGNKIINEYINTLSNDELLLLDRRNIIKREILCGCSSEKELNEKEQYGVSELKAQDLDIACNITNGGNGGTGKGCVGYNDGKTEFYINTLIEEPELHGKKGRLKERFKDANKDTIGINNGVEQKHLSPKEAVKFIESGGVYGMLDRGDIGRSHTGKFERTPEIRKIYSQTAKKTIADGRNPGGVANQFKAGEQSFCKNMVGITNGLENHYIKKDDEIPEGYWYGCTQKKKKIRKVINLDTCEIYDSVLKANKAYNIKKDISLACNGKLETAAGYRGAYFEEDNEQC